MYKVIKDNESIALVEKPRYIRLSKEGAFIQCEKDEAQGIALNSTFYRFFNVDLPGYEVIDLAEVEGGEYLVKHGEQIKELNTSMDTTMVGLAESYEGSLKNTDDINSALLALAELYEDILALQAGEKA